MRTARSDTRPRIEYPLQLAFKIVAIAPQISIKDASGRLLYYVKQKAFKLKEKVTVFADEAQTRAMYAIAADRILDISAQYHVTAADGAPLGTLKRHGMRSIWRAHYEVLRGSTSVFTIREENPWVKVLDGLLGEIPILGLLTGHFFHPAYLLSRASGTAALRVQKKAAFFEGRYVVTQQGELAEEDEVLALLAIMMMLLLERTRG